LGFGRRCDNRVLESGGGIFTVGGTVTLSAGTVAGNNPDNCEPTGTIAGCTG